VTADEYVTLL